jgi:hypothetical protein
VWGVLTFLSDRKVVGYSEEVAKAFRHMLTNGLLTTYRDRKPQRMAYIILTRETLSLRLLSRRSKLERIRQTRHLV